MKNKIIRAAALALCILTLACTLAGCAERGASVLTLDGYEINENMYNYWLASYKSYLLYMYGQDSDSSDFWNIEVADGMTAEDYGNEFALSNIKNVLVGMKLFDDNKLTLDPSVVQNVDMQIEEYITSYGSEAAFNAVLSEVGINVDMLREIYLNEEKLTAVYNHLYGDGKGVTEADIDSYYNEHYSQIKVAIIYTTEIVTDENGEAVYGTDGYIQTEDMSEEEIIEKLAKAGEMLKRAEAGEDFDTLVKEYSEFDMSTYANGLFVSENEISFYGYNLVYGAMTMAEGEIKTIEDENAVYVVQKEKLMPRASHSASDSAMLADLATYCSNELYTELLATEAEKIVINEEKIKEYSIKDAKSGISF